MEQCPAWYSKITIKPHYENETTKVYWDIPEYYGNEEDEEDRTLRPDGKIILEEKKKMYVLEMSVPWPDNRDAKYDEKQKKYEDIVQRLKIDHPNYDVKQLTFIIDGLGGYSKELVSSLRNLFDTREVDSILYGMQKIVLTEAVAIIRQFKIRTQK